MTYYMYIQTGTWILSDTDKNRYYHLRIVMVIMGLVVVVVVGVTIQKSVGSPYGQYNTGRIGSYLLAQENARP